MQLSDAARRYYEEAKKLYHSIGMEVIDLTLNR
jgi:hypothetical protein